MYGGNLFPFVVTQTHNFHSLWFALPLGFPSEICGISVRHVEKNSVLSALLM
jgi:hypothetical protein